MTCLLLCHKLSTNDDDGDVGGDNDDVGGESGDDGDDDGQALNVLVRGPSSTLPQWVEKPD